MEAGKKELKHEDTELRLGLPGTEGSEKQPQNCTNRINKRAFSDMNEESTSGSSNIDAAPPTKVQAMGWPPIRSYRKNCFQGKKAEGEEGGNTMYVKVSMDGAPYLRKIDLKLYKGYPQLLNALEDMFEFKVGKQKTPGHFPLKHNIQQFPEFATLGQYTEREGYSGSEYVPTYEDKDGDWMLVGDVPWDMFINSCKRLRIMKGSEARGLGCLA
ncbi:hypothetical protein Ancab_024016 [Ancistrocladus abbreviatus]